MSTCCAAADVGGVCTKLCDACVPTRDTLEPELKLQKLKAAYTEVAGQAAKDSKRLQTFLTTSVFCIHMPRATDSRRACNESKNKRSLIIKRSHFYKAKGCLDFEAVSAASIWLSTIEKVVKFNDLLALLGVLVIISIN